MNRFFAYLFVQMFVVLAVILTFRFLANRGVAASIAGSLFLLSTFGILMFEWRQKKRSSLLLALNGLFLIGFCVPILLLHIFYFGKPLDEIHVLGFPAQKWHEWSSPMMVTCMIAAGLEGLRSFMTPRLKSKRRK